MNLIMYKKCPVSLCFIQLIKRSVCILPRKQNECPHWIQSELINLFPITVMAVYPNITSDVLSDATQLAKPLVKEVITICANNYSINILRIEKCFHNLHGCTCLSRSSSHIEYTTFRSQKDLHCFILMLPFITSLLFSPMFSFPLTTYTKKFFRCGLRKTVNVNTFILTLP